jgi:murein DD-endopeptidase MepM/ murein hydrolase activator NlpD
MSELPSTQEEKAPARKATGIKRRVAAAFLGVALSLVPAVAHSQDLSPPPPARSVESGQYSAEEIARFQEFLNTHFSVPMPDGVYMISLGPNTLDQNGQNCTVRGYSSPNKVMHHPYWGTEEAIDVQTLEGQPVSCMADGIVVEAGYDNWSDGRNSEFTIIVEHTIDGMTFHSRYGHLDPNFAVKVGDNVKRGQVLGTVMASTEFPAEHPHLHVELNQVQIDTNGNKLIVGYPLRYQKGFFWSNGNDSNRTCWTNHPYDGFVADRPIAEMVVEAVNNLMEGAQNFQHAAKIAPRDKQQIPSIAQEYR